MNNNRLERRNTRRGSLENRLLISCAVLLVAGGILVATMAGKIHAMEEQRSNDVQFNQFAELFAEIFNRVKEGYVDEVDNKKLFEGAINGMFRTLDPHSGYLPPDQKADLTRDTEGEYSGVGMEITLDKDGILTVVSPMQGSPAALAGVVSWDRIIEIEGKSTEDVSLHEAVKQLTGPTGTTVKITIWRQGVNEPLRFELKREKIKVESVFHRVLADDIGYLRISKFQDDTAERVRAALKEFNEEPVKGVIVDVRSDSGGLLDRAVEICDMFLDKGQVIVSTKGRNPKNNHEYVDIEPKLCAQPLIVLVNNGSASASEIFAGAMKDTGRGLIMGPAGKTTFGKGSVQTISQLRHSIDFDDKGNPLPSDIRLTTAKYYTPSGVSIHDIGITPDIGIELPPNHERELQRHGLIGDPSRIEKLAPAAKDEATTGTQTEGEAEEEENKPHLLEKLTQKPEEEQSKEDFRDILLDEAIKYMKAVLILDKRTAA